VGPLGIPTRLSANARYAVQALLDVAAGAPAWVSAAQVASARGIPVRVLRWVLLAQAQAGLARAKVGPDGGYRLARPLPKVTLLEVIEAVDGPAPSAARPGLPWAARRATHGCKPSATTWPPWCASGWER
jgi:Rrf2 family protein